ncbi:hypothetical protein [Rhodospirillum centenum]|uniref:Uncharacterized protein n=1 Tax=Rhodospirillum centenum (strain ATCC 51521 / SW) TaxID=414684 RepID=B6IQ79_RHOCS|nr:hypothetical protein [Rhodospirillum centenum]ACI97615.1 hypothetical protein RC1_0166 [Rhodospirillum centenum SW]
MITEIRHIIFSNDELKLVFQTVPLDGFDPARRITRIEVMEGPPPSVRIRSEAPGGPPSELDVEAYQLARLIVSYCRDKRIPLPKDALKTLHAQGEQLCFSIMSTLG